MTKLKIVFEPGSFDDFDGTQEELDELVKAITDFIESGEFLETLDSAERVTFENFDKNSSRTIH